MDDVSGRVLILTGPPGAGKTTVARLVTARFARAVHIESDVFFHFIESGFIEPWKTASHEQNEIVMGVVADVATSYAQASYSTVVEGIFLPGWFYEPVRDHLERAGLEVTTTILRPSLATCIGRARHRASDPMADPAVVNSSGVASQALAIPKGSSLTTKARSLTRQRRRSSISGQRDFSSELASDLDASHDAFLRLAAWEPQVRAGLAARHLRCSFTVPEV